MQHEMRGFWNRRAQENAFYFVDNRVAYRSLDGERFWEDGKRDLETLLGCLGVAVAPNDRVLEIGCGVGRLTRTLAARAASVLAVDVSEQMLELARTLNPGLANVRWILGDGSSLAGIEPASVDVCVSHVVFQHIPDPSITLGYVREMARVLRPGGWAAFQVSNDPSVHRPRPVWTRLGGAALALLGRRPRGQDDPRWRGSSIEIPDLRRVAEEGSMHTERVVGEGTQMCCVLTRRLDDADAPP